MNYNDNPKPTLFISYCWDDGSVYADELEALLVDYFEVKRDIRTSRAYTSRILKRLQDKKIVEVVGEGKTKKYIVK